MTIPAIEDLIGRAVDVAEAKIVQVEIDRQRNMVYVHVDGVTLFRACRSEKISRIEKAPRKKRKRLCPAWPKCRCIVRGTTDDCPPLPH